MTTGDAMCSYQFCSDSEGPLCLNDNAFELTKCFVPDGDRLFATLSAYDDYLVDIVKKPNYKAGDTLRLILPFLKVYGATNRAVENYSRQAVNWVPRARDALEYIKQRMDTFIITTSYEQFAYPMYQAIGIPRENIYCTRLNLDEYSVSSAEIAYIKKLAQEITAMPSLVLEEPLPGETRLAVSRLDEIFWQEISNMDCGRLMQNTQVVGGDMKAQAIRDTLQRTGSDLERVMFVGDSITDVEAFKLVRQAGGLSISFNGNAYALREAEIACISPTAYVTAVLALVFADGGREQVYELVNHWSGATLSKLKLPEGLIRPLFAEPETAIQIETITPANCRELTDKSQQMRKHLRGKQIGALG
jgi:energy-converting hydrogenase A subunit R